MLAVIDLNHRTRGDLAAMHVLRGAATAAGARDTRAVRRAPGRPGGNARRCAGPATRARPGLEDGLAEGLRYSGSPRSAAAAFAEASDTASNAFAPMRALFGVPSSSIRPASRAACSAASSPCMAWAISPLTWLMALRTPLPPEHLASPSRNSIASSEPVDASERAAVRPRAPLASVTSAAGTSRRG